MVWFLVIWWSVIPYPYPSEQACEVAKSTMIQVGFDGIPLASPRSWCIPAPKPELP